MTTPPEAFATACRNGDLAAVRTALDAGTDPNTSIPFDDGECRGEISALYFACVGNHTEVVTLLLARGARPNDGESVYHAAELNHRACLELLLAHGADLSGRSESYGNTPLYFLSACPQATAVLGMKWLLEHGADPNVTSGKERATPLQCAAQLGRCEVVALLLEHGAAAGAPRADGRTAYALAVRGGHADVIKVLEQGGASGAEVPVLDRFIGACARGAEAEARAILARSGDLFASFSEEDKGTIVQAAHEGRTDAIRVMHHLGFDLAWEGAWGGTALHHAAWHGNVPLTRLLLELKAPVNVRDRRLGSSPLGWAAHGSRHNRDADDDYLAIVNALLAAGADRETSINRWGEPPEQLGSAKVDAFLVRHWNL